MHNTVYTYTLHAINADLIEYQATQEKYNFTIGYLDHNWASSPLIARILKIIEKHFTNSRRTKFLIIIFLLIKELNDLLK